MGVSTFAIDGFTGRGLTGVSTNQAALGRLNFIFDMYRALAVLANHPRVDRTRVALMGFSRGGQAALYAAMRRFDIYYWNKSGIEVAAYVAFYPDCMTTYIGDTDMTDHPIRIFGGAIDDYNPIARCKDFVTRLHEAHHDVELTEYPDAPHGFDNPLGSTTPTVAKNAQTVRNCVIREETKGVLINKATDKPFSYTDACVEHDPHVGYDPDAAASAKIAVQDFLRAVFRLD